MYTYYEAAVKRYLLRVFELLDGPYRYTRIAVALSADSYVGIERSGGSLEVSFALTNVAVTVRATRDEHEDWKCQALAAARWASTIMATIL
jgi:hypothetical protein